jgi:hypothetical protein
VTVGVPPGAAMEILLVMIGVHTPISAVVGASTLMSYPPVSARVNSAAPTDNPIAAQNTKAATVKRAIT